MVDPEEVIQDIFIKLWIKREAMITLRSLEPYLYQMAKNRLIDLHKGRSAREKYEMAYGGHTASIEERSHQDLEFKELNFLAIKAINTLSDRQRRIYQLYIINDLSIDEITHALHLSKSVVKKQLYYASRIVRDYMRQYKNPVFVIAFLLPLLRG
jgi:RNA polymerase sigma factor (sigma-70 family)